MLARKTVARGALSKRLNAQLKASQAQESEHSDNSFKSASEGEGTGSSDYEKIQSSPSKVRSVLVQSVENRFVLVGSVRNVEMPESRRRGGKNEKEKESEGASCHVRGTGIEVVDSLPTFEMVKPAICGTEDEIVGESGKKTGGSGLGEAAEGLGRATRSMVKQSESELQKALAESKKKRMDKRKAKVVESSAAIDVEEIEQVHQEEHTTVEVQTPKPKKTKTSSKKSSTVFETTEPSLVKRIRSTMKNKQIRITEEEEWSGEEESESNDEQDKLAKFGKRKILKGRLLKDLVEPGMV
ncbi:uncharacterized protein [Nicotiana sylvestris]|uniref:uncharacterized protein n=1 Tax=Nicotiana sylvestris TaxID=4096 RepID=UPI00388C90BF